MASFRPPSCLGVGRPFLSKWLARVVVDVEQVGGQGAQQFEAVPEPAGDFGPTCTPTRGTMR
jgi:hypothetical protein